MSLTQNFKLPLLAFAASFTLVFALAAFSANAQEADTTDTLDSDTKKAEELVRELSETLAGTPDDDPAKSEAKTFFNNARKALNEVHPALASGDRDEATSRAASAVQLAAQGISKLSSGQAEQFISQDENISNEDLGVGEPNILPGNPLYAFKGAFRGIQSFITFNTAKKAELKLRFANEKISEARKLSELGASDERLKDAIESYTEEVSRVKVEYNKLGQVEKAEIEKIVEKTADKQIKHHKLLGKFMRDREAIAPEIESKKSEAMKHFSESISNSVDPEVMREKFINAIKKQKGSSFRHFKHIEVLEEVKDFVPEEARGSIQNAIEQSSKLFEEEFEKAEEAHRKIFDEYMEKVGGNEVRHLEAFDSINSFADVKKEMFEEMEKARKKTRKRVEHRMKNIQDKTRKKVFISHLEDAEMEDARIVKELENNLSPETVTSILDIKHRMDQKIREKFEQAESEDDLNSFFEEIGDKPDVRMLEVMEEMEEVVPEDKKEFWEEMKKKAIAHMQSKVDRAKRFGRLEDEFRQMAGFDPEQMAVIENFQDEFGEEVDFFEGIQRNQAAGVKERFEHFREFMDEHPDDAEFFQGGERFRLRFEENEATRERIEQFIPQIKQDVRGFDARKRNLKFSEENLNEMTEKAEKLVKKLSEKVAAGSDKPGWLAANKLLTQARRALNEIHQALAGGRRGEAFGKATSAIHFASNGLRKLEESEFKKERGEYFEERDDFRRKFKELPRDERPDPSQFLKFESKVFPDFMPHKQQKPTPAPAFSPKKKIEDEKLCAQVLTPARNKRTKKCVVFPNACIPEGWERVEKCEEKESFIPDFEKKFKFLEENIIDRDIKVEFKREDIEVEGDKHEISEPEEERILDQQFKAAIITCCLESGSCVRQNERNCKAAGGTVANANSCNPNPCKEESAAQVPQTDKETSIEGGTDQLKEFFR